MDDSAKILISLQEHKEKNEKAWSKGYHLFPEIIQSRGLKIGVEIGVAFGGHSKAILSNTDVQKLYGVDSYQYSEDYDDGMNLSQQVFDLLYEQVKKRLLPFGNRFELIRAKSLEAASIISVPIDFVYIDADHSYGGCLRDITAWFPKVRDGGIIGGHDYNSSVHPDVTKAVDRFFGHLDWHVNYEGHGCWWVEKQQLDVINKVRLLLSQSWWRSQIIIIPKMKSVRELLRRGKRYFMAILKKTHEER